MDAWASPSNGLQFVEFVRIEDCHERVDRAHPNLDAVSVIAKGKGGRTRPFFWPVSGVPVLYASAHHCSPEVSLARNLG